MIPSKKNRYLLILTILTIIVDVHTLPTSLIEEVKSNELRENKIKRAHGSIISDVEEDPRQPVPYYNNPTAIKRGVSYKNEDLDDQTKEWYQDGSIFDENNMSQLPPSSSLYNDDETTRLLNDKSITEYEKGFRYGTNKDKLKEALENAVLKSELYGEPSAINQYRYYGTGMEEKRRKRNIKKFKLDNRMKREVEFSPEDILTLLTLWENERQQHNPQSFRNNYNYNNNWQRFNPSSSSSMQSSAYDFDGGPIDNFDNDMDDNDENWLDAPVYPHVVSGHDKTMNTNYYYDDKPHQQQQQQLYDKRVGQWGSFIDNKKKRFMVARKRNDPTRELHYLTGGSLPSQTATLQSSSPLQDRNDFYTLAQLLSQQREQPNVPIYHRIVL